MRTVVISGLLSSSLNQSGKFEGILNLPNYKGEFATILVSSWKSFGDFRDTPVIIVGEINFEKVDKEVVVAITATTICRHPDLVSEGEVILDEMVNQINLFGNAAVDSAPRYFENGSMVAENAIYVNVTKDQNFCVNLKCWGNQRSTRQADAFCQYVAKGRQIACSGTLEFNTADDGRIFWSVKVVKFDLTRRDSSTSSTSSTSPSPSTSKPYFDGKSVVTKSQPQPVDYDEIPF